MSQACADFLVQCEFGALLPGQGVAQELGQMAHFPDDGVLHGFGVVACWQVQQDGEPGGVVWANDLFISIW